MPGTSATREAAKVRNYWACEPAKLPCVKVPDLARFDWPAARHPEQWETRPRMSASFLQAALPPSRDRTGKTAVASRPRRRTVHPGPARRFAGPSGGTEEFLGRWSARSSSWGAEAKG